jgi:hypothetical protein
VLGVASGGGMHTPSHISPPRWPWPALACQVKHFRWQH